MKFVDRIRRLLAALGDSGAAAIEFAVVGSAFMLMLLASFEFGYMLFVQSALDNSARDAARLVRTGQAQQSANAQTTFSTLLCNDIGTIIGCGNLVYQSLVFNDWTSAQNSINAPPNRDPVTGKLISAGFNAGNQGQIVVVTVSYNYPFFTPWVGGFFGASKSAFLMSTVVFQNEPY